MSLLFSITIILIMLLGQYEGIFFKKKITRILGHPARY